MRRKEQRRKAHALSVARWCLAPGEACDDDRDCRLAKRVLRRATLAALTCVIHPANKAKFVTTAVTRRVFASESYESYESFLVGVFVAAGRRRRGKGEEKLRRRRSVVQEKAVAVVVEEEEEEESDGDGDGDGMSESDDDAAPAPSPAAEDKATADDGDLNSDSDIMIVEEVSSAAAAARLKQQQSPASKRRAGRRIHGDEGIAVAAAALGLRLKGERGYGNCMVGFTSV